MKIVLIFACCVFGSVFLFLGFIFLLVNFGPESQPKRTQSTSAKVDPFFEEMNLKYDAEKLTKESVLAILKAPTTAKFSLQTRHDKFRYALVNGSVTSQNSFGAMLTVPVQAIYYNDSGKLKTAMLRFDDKTLFSNEELIRMCFPPETPKIEPPKTDADRLREFKTPDVDKPRPGMRFVPTIDNEN